MSLIASSLDRESLVGVIVTADLGVLIEMDWPTTIPVLKVGTGWLMLADLPPYVDGERIARRLEQIELKLLRRDGIVALLPDSLHPGSWVNGPSGQALPDMSILIDRIERQVASLKYQDEGDTSGRIRDSQ